MLTFIVNLKTFLVFSDIILISIINKALNNLRTKLIILVKLVCTWLQAQINYLHKLVYFPLFQINATH